MKKNIFLVLILLLVNTGCTVVENSTVIARNVSSSKGLEVGGLEKIEKKEVPNNYFLAVPFVMQAPFANWEEHNESCEEAGLLLVNYFYKNQSLSKEAADKELKEMVKYQVTNYGGEYDIYALEMSRLAKDFYGYMNSRVIDGSRENIVQELLNKNPVIVPTTAAYLKPEKNDYPEMGYHVVVIVGYDETGYIVHDPGTYTGENTHYSYGIMDRAMADYDRKLLVLK